MQNQFDIEFNKLENELTFLKTSGQKSAVNVATLQKSIAVNADLKLYQLSSPPFYVARAQKYFEVSSAGSVFAAYNLSWYSSDPSNPDSSTTRRLLAIPTLFGDGKDGVSIYFEGSDDDITRLRNGETITITVTLTVTALDDFEINEVQNV